MEDYKAIIEQNEEAMLEMISQVVAIKSVCEEPVGKKPFGEGVHKALTFFLDKAKEEGFKTKNVSNYAGHVEFKGKTSDVVAIVAHLDIVSEGSLDNWESDPFKTDIRNGNMYGRGVQDDKGPAVMGYYAMKALKEAGFKPQKTIRLILGCDEETATGGIEKYLAKEKAPVAAFTPDALFPVIYAEKGIVVVNICKKIDEADANTGVTLCELSGGLVHNVVPDKARAVVDAKNAASMLKDIVKDSIKTKRYSATCKSEGSKLIIEADGFAAHASVPEMGKNAISVLMDLLGDIKFGNPEINEYIKFYNNNIRFYINGEKMGCKLEDKESGKLTFNAAMISFDNNELKLLVDMRTPVTYEVDGIIESIKNVVEKANLELAVDFITPPLFKDPESDLVKILTKAYEQNTGEKNVKPISLGGGTYAKSVPNTVAFGPVMPDGEETCHLANEYMSLKDIMVGTKIFADSLYELSKE